MKKNLSTKIEQEKKVLGSVYFFRSLLAWVQKKAASRGSLFVVLLPFLWLFLFFVLPFCIIIKISFSESIVGIPPYSVIFEWIDATNLHIKLFFNNYVVLLKDQLYLSATITSISIAALSTFFCLLIGYPMALAISRSNEKYRILLLMLVMLPFWTSFLIRVYSWIGLLSNHGLFNNLLIGLGLIENPLPLLYNNVAVSLGITYSYLPFMVLPLYAALSKIDDTFLEAAYDLGCRPFKTFWFVTFPLSMSGVIAGSVLVFIPAVGEFVIPELLGSPDTLMIGKVIWTEFFTNRDWPLAASLATTMLILVVLPVMVFQRIQNREQEAAQ